MHLLLLLVLLSIGACAALPFPSAFVGTEGREVVLRVRFDSPEIVLYESTSGPARAASSSYDAREPSHDAERGVATGERWRRSLRRGAPAPATENAAST